MLAIIALMARIKFEKDNSAFVLLTKKPKDFCFEKVK